MPSHRELIRKYIDLNFAGNMFSGALSLLSSSSLFKHMKWFRCVSGFINESMPPGAIINLWIVVNCRRFKNGFVINTSLG